MLKNLLMAALLVAATTGCWKSETETNVDDMTESVEATTNDVVDSAEEMGDDVTDAASDMADDVEDSVDPE